MVLQQRGGRGAGSSSSSRSGRRLAGTCSGHQGTRPLARRAGGAGGRRQPLCLESTCAREEIPARGVAVRGPSGGEASSAACRKRILCATPRGGQSNATGASDAGRGREARLRGWRRMVQRVLCSWMRLITPPALHLGPPRPACPRAPRHRDGAGCRPEPMPPASPPASSSAWRSQQQRRSAHHSYCFGRAARRSKAVPQWGIDRAGEIRPALLIACWPPRSRAVAARGWAGHRTRRPCTQLPGRRVV
jgi:hypothetical protein